MLINHFEETSLLRVVEFKDLIKDKQNFQYFLEMNGTIIGGYVLPPGKMTTLIFLKKNLSGSKNY